MGCRFFGGRSQEFQYIIEVACVHLSNFCWIMRVDESGDAIGMLQMWSLQEAHTHSYTISLHAKWYRFVVVMLTLQLITKIFGWEPKVSEEHAGYFVFCFTYWVPVLHISSWHRQMFPNFPRHTCKWHLNTATLMAVFSSSKHHPCFFFSEKRGTPEKTPFIHPHSHFFHHVSRFRWGHLFLQASRLWPFRIEILYTRRTSNS